MSVPRSHPPHTHPRSTRAAAVAGAAMAASLAVGVLAASAATPSAVPAHQPQGHVATGPAAAAEAAVQDLHDVAGVATTPPATPQQVVATQRAQVQERRTFLTNLAWDTTVARTIGWDTAVAKFEAAKAAAAAPARTYAAPATASASSSVSATLACIRNAESGGDYSAVNAGSGAGGAYQFMPSTWAALGGSGLPENAPPAEQDAMAMKLYEERGWEPWSGDGCV